MRIRNFAASDAAEIRKLLLQAFPGEDEARLVEAIRRDGDDRVELVAEVDGVPVGHILLSEMRAPEKCLGLAPVAVAESHRRQGIAAALIREALARAGEWQAVITLGDPDYYRRFGFSAETAAPYRSGFAGPYLMMRLTGDEPPPGDEIRYCAAFDALEG